MQYTKIEVKNFNQKDKRISFLSIFSTLISQYTNIDRNIDGAFIKAIELTERLYEKYPILEEGDEGMEVIEHPM